MEPSFRVKHSNDRPGNLVVSSLIPKSEASVIEPKKK